MKYLTLLYSAFALALGSYYLSLPGEQFPAAFLLASTAIGVGVVTLTA